VRSEGGLGCTFLFWVFFFKRAVGDVRRPHFRRLEPAIPGFPVLISRVSSYKDWSRVYDSVIRSISTSEYSFRCSLVAKAFFHSFRLARVRYLPHSSASRLLEPLNSSYYVRYIQRPHGTLYSRRRGQRITSRPATEIWTPYTTPCC